MTWWESLQHQLRYTVAETRQIAADLKECFRAFHAGFTGKWDR
jgi:ppGpp synthetase/RelA/SpoT-type nucleotidyltranferase